MSNLSKNVVPLYKIYKSKLITPLINAVRSGGNLVQVINVVCLTNTQYSSRTERKNITVCSSSCKNQEVSGIPSFTCREGKDSIVLEENEEGGWIYLPYHYDVEQFEC